MNLSSVIQFYCFDFITFDCYEILSNITDFINFDVALTMVNTEKLWLIFFTLNFNIANLLSFNLDIGHASCLSLLIGLGIIFVDFVYIGGPI